MALVDLDIERAGEVAAELPGAIALEANVADEVAVRTAVQAAHERLGSIDCVFNGAGHADLGPIEDWSYERFNKMMNVHMGGTFLVCREVIPLMRENGSGSIVNVASIAALIAQPNNAPYGAAKGAILAFSRQNRGGRRARYSRQRSGSGSRSHRDDPAAVHRARWRRLREGRRRWRS